MASDIIDIIHNLEYQVNTTPLEKALASVQAQTNTIGILNNRLNHLQKAYEGAGKAGDTASQARIANNIKQTKNAIESQTRALVNNVAQNKLLNDVVQKEIGLVGGLEAQLRRLKDARTKATSADAVKDYTRQIDDAKRQLSDLTGTAGRPGKSLLSKLGSGLAIGAGFGAANLIGQGISEVRQFVTESIRLAEELEGVQVAFNRLNQPELLDNLRSATRGNVSDLELMKNAVQFQNFGLPIDRLAEALEFAYVRARETGQSYPKRLQFVDMMLGTGFAAGTGTAIEIDVLAFAAAYPYVDDPDKLVQYCCDLLLGIDPSTTRKTNLKSNLLSGQTSNYYWTQAWQEYVNAPSNATKKGIVQTRLAALLKEILKSAEHHLA